MATTQAGLALKKMETKKNSSIEFLGGCSAGIVQVLSGQPFDTVKVRLQTQSEGNKMYNGVLDCVRKIWKNEGPTAFYKGTAFPLAGIAVCVSIQFGVVEASKRQLKRIFNRTELNAGQLFLAGGISGIANSIASIPVEHLRIRMQIQDQHIKIYQNSWDCFRKILGNHGITGMYKGAPITLLRELWCYGNYFAAYDLVLKALKNPGESQSETALWKSGIAGAVAGFSYWFFGYPIDVIKTKLQTDSFTNPKYRGSVDCAKQLLTLEGPKAFTKGMTPCLARAMPVNALGFITYETLVGHLKQKY